MIIYTTIAFGTAYSLFAQKLVESFVQWTTKSHLVVVTDCPHLFQSFPNVTICSYTPDYKAIANEKVQAIHFANQLFPNEQVIIYMDCDCFFIDTPDNKALKSLVNGLHASLGVVIKPLPIQSHQLENQGMREKWQFFDRDTLLYVFVERAFILVGDNYNKLKFVTKWKELKQSCIDNRLTNAGEFIEIQLAAIHVHLPIYNIWPHQIQNVIMTEERDEAVYSAFR